MSMENKKLLLVGASGELGSKLRPFLVEDGYLLIPHYFKHHIEDGYCADLQNPNEVKEMIAKILKEYGSIDILINCAGISIDGMAHKYNYEDWKRLIDINLSGVFYCIREVLPSMRDNNYGRIISISSVVGRIGIAGTAAYSASKAGLIGLTKTIAIENITKGITCTSIALGYTAAGLMARLPQEEEEKILQRIPMKRFCEIEELYNTIDFLIRTPYTTGQTIDLNGGLF